MRERFDTRKRTSTASIRQQQYPEGMPLNDCLHPQRYVIEIEVKDPEGGLVCNATMSYDQFVQLLLFNGDVKITLKNYRDKEGNLVKEEVQPPDSVEDRFLKNMGKASESIEGRMSDLKRDLYELVNSGKPAGKKALAELHHQMDIILGHYRSNLPYFVGVAAEEVAEIQENAKSQLSIFAQQALGANLEPGDFTPMLQGSSQLALPEKHDKPPVVDDYQEKERKEKPIDKMTAMEVADALTRRLKAFEVAENKYFEEHKRADDDRKQLYGSHASESQGKVAIQYISYHGSHKYSLEDARNYLKFLRGVNKLGDFKTIFNFLEKH